MGCGREVSSVRPKALAWGPGDSWASIRYIGRSNKFGGEVSLGLSGCEGPRGAPGEAFRMSFRAGGLWRLRDGEAMFQLTVYLKLEPSDKSKKRSA